MRKMHTVSTKSEQLGRKQATVAVQAAKEGKEPHKSSWMCNDKCKGSSSLLF